MYNSAIIEELNNMSRRTKTWKERLEGKYKIDEVTGCWNWTGNCQGGSSLPYGVLVKRGEDGIRISRSAHRVSYEVYHDLIPDGICVLHKCDNPKCINPDHLELGTKSDNNKQKMERGRMRPARGVSNGSATLTEEQVLEIYNYRNYNGVGVFLAKKYKVHPTTISIIRLGKTWKHLTKN